MIVASAILLLVAVITLIIGIFGTGLQMITVSIVSSILAGVALTVGLLQGRKKPVPSIAGIPLGTEGTPEEPQMREASLFRASASPARGSDAPSAPLPPLEVGGGNEEPPLLERMVVPPPAGRPLEIGSRSGNARPTSGMPLRVSVAKPKAARAAAPATGSARPAPAKSVAKTARAAKPATTAKPRATAAKSAKPAAAKPAVATKSAKPAAVKTTKDAAKPTAAEKPKAAKTPVKPKAPARKPAAKKAPPSDSGD